MTNFKNITNTAKAKLANLLDVKISEIRVNSASIDATGKISHTSLSFKNKNITVELPIKDGSYNGWAGCEVFGQRDKNGFVPVSANFVITHFA